MPRVDFYLLKSDSPNERLIFSCRLAEKAYDNNSRLYIHMDNQQEAEALNKTLWTFRQNSFIPHQLYNPAQKDDFDTPILIGYGAIPAIQSSVVLNLSNGTPRCFDDFERILEVIPSDETSKKLARMRYKHYRECNYTLETHNIG